MLLTRTLCLLSTQHLFPPIGPHKSQTQDGDHRQQHADVVLQRPGEEFCWVGIRQGVRVPEW